MTFAHHCIGWRDVIESPAVAAGHGFESGSITSTRTAQIRPLDCAAADIQIHIHNKEINVSVAYACFL